MSDVSYTSNLIQEVMQLGLCFVLVSFSVAAHVVQAAEAPIALDKDTLSVEAVNSDTHWLPDYRINSKIELKWSKSAASTRLGFSSTPQLLVVTEPKREDDWSITIQRQIPTMTDCSPLSSYLCPDSIDQGPDIQPQHDSLWFVLRKPFDF
jgi:hypothetical protein